MKFAKSLLSGLLVCLLVIGWVTGSTVYGQGRENRNPIAICHRTASHTNQYVSETVDQDAVDGDNGNDNGQGDHYLEHVGPVWYEGIEGEWGDIIPAIAGVHDGLNWTAEGQAIWNNSCNVPGSNEEDPSPSPSADPSDDPQGNHSSYLNLDGPRCDSTKFTAKVRLTIDGVAANGVAVTFTYQGSSLPATTDANGEAQVTFTFFSPGTVTMNAVDPEAGFPQASGEVKAADQCESRGGSSSAENSGGQVLGASTGQVLGASTLAETGSAQQTIVSILFTIAAGLVWTGVRLYAPKKDK